MKATLFFVIPANFGLILNAQGYLLLNSIFYQTVLKIGTVLNASLAHFLSNLKFNLPPLVL